MTSEHMFISKEGKVLTDRDIEALSAEAEHTYLVDPERGVAVGQRRVYVPRRKADPHTVMRLNVLTQEVYVKYDDKTTEWNEFRLYIRETKPL